jgi:CheY-like chemotaxis protein/HPt (histidine-containing phosphotransfer) domain-containing protein
MGGDIGVTSEPGKGSAFSFTCRFGTSNQPARPARELPSLAGKRVLVVDDNPYARQVLAEILSSFALNVAMAADGHECLFEVERATRSGEPFELIFLDWQMPGMNGVETACRLRELPELAGHLPPIFLVTAYNREDVLDQVEGHGLLGPISKPVTPSTVLDAIHHELGGSVDRASDGAVDAEAALRAELERHRGSQVLLVEDNEINQQIAQEILTEMGLEVTIAANGRQAVERVGREAFQLVLMDCQMPVLNGYDATRELRADPQFADLPILAMTANAMAGDRERCLEAGMNDHIAKPIDPHALMTALVRWLPAAALETPGEPSAARSPQVEPPPAPVLAAPAWEPPAAAAAASPRPMGPEVTVAGASPSTREPDRMNFAAPPALDGLPSSLPGIDLADGLARLAGNQALYTKLLRSFAGDYRTAPVRIREALEEDDAEAATRLAHSVRGVAGNLGAKRVQEAAARLELACNERRTAEVAELLSDLAAELGRVLDPLDAWFRPTAQVPLEARELLAEPNPVEADRPVDAAAARVLLATLTRMLDDGDFESGRVLEELAALLGGGSAAELGPIRELVDAYDFEAARQRVEALNALIDET